MTDSVDCQGQWFRSRQHACIGGSELILPTKELQKKLIKINSATVPTTMNIT